MDGHNTFSFRILTPGGELVQGDITQIHVRSHLGSLGVMAKHEPLVAACPAGIIRIQQDGVWVRFKSEAFLLKMDGTSVTILTSFAQYHGDRTEDD
jgi:F0F1-type ATP synthase epsilon subunit